jgi:hypothetical protein
VAIQQQPGPGQGRINRNLVAAATAVPGFVAARAHGATAGGAIFGSIGNVLTQTALGPTAALLGIMTALLKVTVSLVRETGLYAKGIQQAASIERIESAFTTLYRSSARAKQEIKTLLDFANRTPFRYDSILEAGRTLLVLTRGAFAGAAALKKVGDVSAATGSDIQDTAFWLGKLFNYLQSGRSVGNLLFRLQDMGIITGELANKLEALETQGASFGQKWAAVEQEIGRANGAMQEENRSLDGLQARLQRTSEMLAKGFGTPFLEQEKASTYAAIKLYESFIPLLTQIGQETAAVTGIFRKFNTDIKGNIVDTLGLDRVFKGLYETMTVLGGGALLAGVSRIFGVAGAGAVRGMGSGGVRGLTRGMQGRAAAGTLTGGGQALYARGQADYAGARSAFGLAASQAGGLALVDAAGSALRGSGRAARGYVSSVRGRAMDLAASSQAAAAARAARPGLAGAAGRLVGGVQLGTGTAVGVILLRDAWKGVLSVVQRVASVIARGVLSIGWIGAAAMAVGGLVVHFKRLQNQYAATERANNALARSITDTSRAMRDQLQQVRTLADYHAALAVAVENLSKAQQRLEDFDARGKPKAGAKDERRILEFGVRQAQTELSQVKDRGRGPLLRTSEEERERAQNRRDLDTTEFQVAYERADEAGKAALLAERAAKLQRDASEGEMLREAERTDPAAKTARDIGARRQELQNEQARSEAFAQDFKERPNDVRARVAADLAVQDATPAQQAEIDSIVQQLSARGVTAPKGQLVYGEIGRLQAQQRAATDPQVVDDLAESIRLLERLGDVRADATRKPTGDEVQAEIDRRLGRGAAIQGELKGLGEQEAQAERESQSPLTRINRQIIDLTQKLNAATPGSPEQLVLLDEIARLTEESNRAQLNKEQAPELKRESIDVNEQARQAKFQADTTAIGLETERKILQLRNEGLAYELEANRLRLEGLRAEAARTRTEYGPDDQRTKAAENAVAQAQQQQQALQRQQAASAAEIVTNRRAAQALASGDKKGAQAIRDQEAIRGRAVDLVNTFGVGADEAEQQARRDYFTEQLAAARDQAPRITTDSLQAIGGGGGAFGADPVKQVMERNARAAEQSANTLEQIRWLLAGRAPSPMEKLGYLP